jgi:hypothetical protein
MSGRAVARGIVVTMAVGLVLGAPARANEAAHKVAEKFAGSEQGADKGKPGEAKQPDKDKAGSAMKAEQEAAAARKRAAALKARAARKAAEARRQAADAARRAAEQRKADEADMLARARREAEEMRSADEYARLTQEARRLVEEAEKERARAEALLAGQGDEKRVEMAEEEGLARRRTEEIRRLTEKLNRVRQVREAGLAAQARRPTEPQTAATTLEPPTPASDATASARATPEPAARSDDPPMVADIPPEVTPAANVEPSLAARVPPPASPPAAVMLPPIAAESAPVPPVAASPQLRSGTRVAAAEMHPNAALEIPAASPPPELSASAPARLLETRVTVLLTLEPGTYGIRRRGPRVADPILCVPEGCYISAGPDQPAVFMPGRRAFKFGNTFGIRAGACSNSLGCVFRGVDLGSLPGYLQPVDLHILRHDRREAHTVLTDSGCRSEAGRLSCTHGVHADDYVMWVLPDSMAADAGPAALERAVADGLNGRRSAELVPR